MKKCPHCGHEHDNTAALQCPKCGGFYSKIIELIEEEAADEERNSFRGRCLRIWHSGRIWQETKAEVRAFIKGLPLTAKFTLFVIATFVFALIVIVL
jgi:uncharacterized membrane protein YvbJ